MDVVVGRLRNKLRSSLDPVLAGLVVLLLFLSYMLVHRFFPHLKWLNAGVREPAPG